MLMNILLDTQFLITNFIFQTKMQLKPQSKSNNQGRSGDLDKNEKKNYMKILTDNSQKSFKNYNFHY